MNGETERAPLLGNVDGNGSNANGPGTGHYRYVGRTRSYATPNRTVYASAVVLFSVVFEKIAFYALVGNLVLFLNSDPLMWLSYNATNALYVFTGLSYMCAIIGGWIADSCLGRYKTIVIFYVIYLIGYAGMPTIPQYPNEKNTSSAHKWCGNLRNESGFLGSLSHYSWTKNAQLIRQIGNSTDQRSPSEETCAWVVYLSIAVIGIGSSGIKANIAPFGADQVKMTGPTASRVFFNWYYWSINIGSLVALGVVAYIQQAYSFFWGYIIPIICLFISTVIFICGFCCYVIKPPTGSIIGNIFRILKEALNTGCRRRHRPRTHSFTSSRTLDEELDAAPGCIDMAKVRYGGSFHDSLVDDVKALGKICCVFAALIPYWIVYLQMSTTFVIQGLHMKLTFGSDDNDTENTCASDSSSKFDVPAAWLSLFDVIFLIILIPLLDRVIYPALDRRGYQLSLRARIVFGMVFAMASVCCAGGLENMRLYIYHKRGIHWQCVGSTHYRAAKLSIMWQIPQYALIGISEAFASIACLELAYIHAPRSMQGLIMGLFWLFTGIGSLLGAATMYFFNGIWFFPWDNGDINCLDYYYKGDRHNCHLDYYFFFLAGLLFLAIIMFIIIAWKLDIGKGAPARHSVHSAISPSGQSRTPPSNNIDNSNSVQIDRSLPFLTEDDSSSPSNS